MLRQFRDVGYGGVYLHPRVGLITEYLSEAWFEAIAFCQKEASALGLRTYLYDENTYPSGFAGGHVPAIHPEARVRYLGYEILQSLPNALNHFTTALDASDLFLAAYHVESESPLRIGRILTDDEFALWIQDQHSSCATDIPSGSVLAFYMREMKGTPWHGEFPYVSLVDPVVAKTFLETTHAEYFKRLGDHFGKSVPAIFTDEPSLLTLNGGASGATLHLTPYIQGEFLRRRGYDLRGHLAELFFDYGDFASVRFDYYETLHELWLENWALPLEGWCQKHGIALTGHYLEHDWPVPYSTPGHVHLLAHMDWPGIDLLLANGLTGEPAPWFSLQERAQPGREPHLTLLIHQCASVARQLDKKKVMCEAWGAGGHASTPSDYKRLGDWLIVNGVNHLVPHHSFMTVRGSRKTDHPQFFSDQSSWFLHTRSLNDHLARLCQAMSQGTDTRSILVLDPLTSGYLTAARSRPTRETHADLCNGFSNFVQSLSDRFLPFDLGDEYVVEEFGISEGKTLRVGQQSYATVVLPAETTNLRSATLQLLTTYLGNGGKILSLMAASPRIDGRSSNAWNDLLARFPSQIQEESAPANAVEWLAHQSPLSLQIENPNNLLGFAHSVREWDGKKMHLLVYSGDAQGTVSVLLKAKDVGILDTLSGEEKKPSYEIDADGLLRFEWTVDGPQSLLLRATEVDTLSPSLRYRPVVVEDDDISLHLKTIQPESDNRLVIDFCDLQLPGKPEIKGIRALKAQKEVFRHHGFLRNPWHRAIQYRKQILGRNQFGPDSGFKVSYSFEILPGTQLTHIFAGIEAPESLQITINGHRLDPDDAKESEIDPWVREFPIGACLREGRNELILAVHPFDVRIELDNIYLVGDFSVQTTGTGFALGGPVRRLGYGSWKSQGYPFYDRSMSYRFEVPELPDEYPSFALDMDAACSLVDILMGEKLVGQLGLTRQPVILPRDVLATGEPLILKVIGSPHNLFGAFHDPSPKRGVVGNPFVGPMQGPVPGSQYHLLDYGLLQAPTLRPCAEIPSYDDARLVEEPALI